jgi:hypothetical protein
MPITDTIMKSRTQTRNLTKLESKLKEQIKMMKIKAVSDTDALARANALIIQFQMENYVKKLQSGIIPVAIWFQYIDIPERTYCKLSGSGPERGANCTSYLQKIFKDLLDCSLYDIIFLNATDKYVTHPKLCRQNVRVPVTPCITRKFLTPEHDAYKLEKIKKAKLPLTWDKMDIEEEIEKIRLEKRRQREEEDSSGKEIKLQFSGKEIDKALRLSRPYILDLPPEQMLNLIMKNKNHRKIFMRKLQDMSIS